MSAAASVRYDIQGGVAFITLSRPERLNALDRPMMRALAAAAIDASTNPDVRAVLVTGDGRAFCAGGDVKAMATGGMFEEGESPLVGGMNGAAELHRAVGELYRMPKPVIAAVNGPALGAGVGLALSADVVWASESSTFGLAYMGIGLSPDGGTTFFVPRIVGARRAAELFMTNRKLTSAEALTMGFCSRVLPDSELLPAATALANQLAQGPTRAYAELKTLLRNTLQNGFETQTEDERYGVPRSVQTDDFFEGIMAFAERRAPQFKGS